MNFDTFLKIFGPMLKKLYVDYLKVCSQIPNAAVDTYMVFAKDFFRRWGLKLSQMTFNAAMAFMKSLRP